MKIIEKDPSRCRELAVLLPRVTVLEGDATDCNLLELENLSDCDAIVTMTSSDEMNMIISLYGESRKIPQIITKLGKREEYNQSLLDNLSLGSIICPRDLCCNDIVRYVRALDQQSGAAISVHAIADGQVEAVEFLVEMDTENCGIPLKQIRLRDDVLIASINHGSTASIPNGDSKFRVGDTLVIVTGGRGVLRQLNDIFL